MSDLALELWNRWAAGLWRTTWQASLVVLVLVLLSRVVTKVTPSLRAWAWWLVCAKVLLGVLVMVSVSVPLLPAPEAVFVTTAQVASSADAVVAAPTPSAPSPVEIPWAGFGWTAWFIWVAMGVERLVRQHRSLTSLTERAQPVESPLANSVLDRLCTQLGVDRPRLVASNELSTPLLTGLLDPCIVLPASSLVALEEAELTLTLAHELSHLRRGDLWWGWVPSLAEVLVGFLPPTWLAVREYTQAREEACDALALAITGRDPETYARLLIAFGVGGRTHAPTAAAGASPHFHHLKRRLLMLGSSRLPRRFPGVIAVMLCALAVIPVTVVAREGDRATIRTASSAGSGRSSGAGGATAVVAGSADLSSTPEQHYIFVHNTGKQDGMRMTMSGSSDDVTRVQQLTGTYGPRFLWFVRGGKEYVVANSSKLDPLEFAEPADISAAERKLNRLQADLSVKEAHLSEQQAALSLEQARLSTQRAELASKVARAANDAERASLERQEAALDAQGEVLDRRGEVLDRQQEALAPEQEALGAEHEKLGALQEAQGQRLERTILELIDRSLAEGWARPVGR